MLIGTCSGSGISLQGMDSSHVALVSLNLAKSDGFDPITDVIEMFQGMDSSHVALVTFNLKSDGFDPYRCD